MRTEPSEKWGGGGNLVAPFFVYRQFMLDLHNHPISTKEIGLGGWGLCRGDRGSDFHEGNGGWSDVVEEGEDFGAINVLEAGLLSADFNDQLIGKFGLLFDQLGLAMFQPFFVCGDEFGFGGLTVHGAGEAVDLPDPRMKVAVV